MTTQTDNNLSYVKKVLYEAEKYDSAYHIVEFDSMTVCPAAGQEMAGDVTVKMLEQVHRLKKDADFTKAVEALYQNREELDEWDRALADLLHRQYLREKHITPAQQSEFDQIKKKAWLSWSRAKKADDFSLFADSLAAVVKAETRRASLWETDPERPEQDPSIYGRLLDENERGITSAKLDELFGECKKRIPILLRRIRKSKKQIRTDFLYRRVTDAQQEQMAQYLLELLGFDARRGMFSLSEHPFTDRMGPDDVRVTTHYDAHFFLSNIYSIIHECGHALLEQNQPRENYAYFLTENKTMGMHESVSRFYENVIGRSEAFIHLIYPKVCEIYPRVMRDVTEEELYQAVNHVTPSLIRTEADELTYTLHIIIRYEIERDLVEGRIQVEDVARVWNEKYQEYLGIVPEHDRDAVLQDVHWASGFGYFPTYALGNFYNAMYYRRMQEDFDVAEAVEQGDFQKINEWMRAHVFAGADRLTPAEWIEDITGRELVAEDFLSYLEEKYTRLYGLDVPDSIGNEHFEGYVRRMAKIHLLSAPQLEGLDTADAYSKLLLENFKDIGELAVLNREVISDVIDPLLQSRELLDDGMVEAIRELNANLMDAGMLENYDLPVMALLSERLMEDALRKGDDAYIIHQLDDEIIACIALIVQTRRISVTAEINDEIRRKGLTALDLLLSYLDKERFLTLDPDSRETIMINTRYGDGLYATMVPLSDEDRAKRFSRIEQSLAYALDPFYREALPGYDWRYHTYRAYQYISNYDENDNAAAFGPEELRKIADYGRKLEELWLSDPEYFETVDTFVYNHALLMRNQYHAGLISAEEYEHELYRIYEMRDTRKYDADSIIENIEIPSEYAAVFSRMPLTERRRKHLDEMFRSAIAYVFHMSKRGMLYELMDYYAPLIYHFIEIPGGMSFEEFGLQSFAAFHPPTYIHSTMVAHISRCLAEHLLGKHPEIFVGVCGCPSADRVPEYREAILEFTYHAALCHDFGKLIIIDTVFVYGRKILDFEFHILKQHPAIGADLLAKYTSTGHYAEVARGHHRWYDNTGGYPNDFDTAKSPVKSVIDIVACADCMDAATDTVGRSYSRGKTLDEYLSEVREGAGTRYAPYFPELFEDPAVYRDLTWLLAEGRKDIYRRTFLLLKKVHENAEI